MRAVPVAVVGPSVTVKSTRNVPGRRAAKSKVSIPPTTVARRRGVVEHARRTRATSARGAGHVRRDIDREAGVDRVDEGEGLHMSAGCGETRTRSGFVVTAPAVSATVTIELDELLAAFAVVAVLVDDVAARRRGDLPIADVFCADSSSSGSPSGSTQPGSTGTVTVPPRATSGVGQGTRHPSTPHHCGRHSRSQTVRVTVVGADRRPPSAVPSVTAYEKVAVPVAPGATARSAAVRRR